MLFAQEWLQLRILMYIYEKSNKNVLHLDQFFNS